MFLDQTIRRNPQLVETAFMLHQEGKILPDSYLVDVDVFLENARRLLQKAGQNHIRLYFMLKQIGRNPYLANWWKWVTAARWLWISGKPL